MKVIRASRAGFCMGVSLALRKLDNAIAQNESRARKLRICTLGPIIHNPQVLKHYSEAGVVCLANCEEIGEQDHVLIRAHGITKAEEAFAAATGCVMEDATCPRVKKAQMAIYEATGPTQPLFLFGEPEHPEVRGLLSYARGEATVFQSLSELLNERHKPEITPVLASQTTQDKQTFGEIAQELKKKLPNLIALSTICDATRQRQEETLRIAREVDCMVVAGGKSSGNTRRLAALARETGIPAFHVEMAAELDKNNLRKFGKIGLTAGASTPLSLIDEIENWLMKL